MSSSPSKYRRLVVVLACLACALWLIQALLIVDADPSKEKSSRSSLAPLAPQPFENLEQTQVANPQTSHRTSSPEISPAREARLTLPDGRTSPGASHCTLEVINALTGDSLEDVEIHRKSSRNRFGQLDSGRNSFEYGSPGWRMLNGKFGEPLTVGDSPISIEAKYATDSIWVRAPNFAWREGRAPGNKETVKIALHPSGNLRLQVANSKKHIKTYGRHARLLVSIESAAGLSEENFWIAKTIDIGPVPAGSITLTAQLESNTGIGQKCLETTFFLPAKVTTDIPLNLSQTNASSFRLNLVSPPADPAVSPPQCYITWSQDGVAKGAKRFLERFRSKTPAGGFLSKSDFKSLQPGRYWISINPINVQREVELLSSRHTELTIDLTGLQQIKLVLAKEGSPGVLAPGARISWKAEAAQGQTPNPTSTTLPIWGGDTSLWLIPGTYQATSLIPDSEVVNPRVAIVAGGPDEIEIPLRVTGACSLELKPSMENHAAQRFGTPIDSGTIQANPIDHDGQFLKALQRSEIMNLAPQPNFMRVQRSLFCYFDKPGRYRITSTKDHFAPFEVEVHEKPSTHTLVLRSVAR